MEPSGAPIITRMAKLVRVPEGEKLLQLTVFRDRFVIATDAGVYMIDDNYVLQPVYFIQPEEMK